MYEPTQAEQDRWNSRRQEWEFTTYEPTVPVPGCEAPDA